MTEQFGPFCGREMELCIKHVTVEAHPESMVIGHVIAHAREKAVKAAYVGIRLDPFTIHVAEDIIGFNAFSVWETTIKKYIPEILEGFYPFKIINHTDGEIV